MENNKNMCESMMEQEHSQMIKMMELENTSEKESCRSSDCSCNEEEKLKNDIVTTEIKPLLDDTDYELLKIKKTKNSCSLCEDYVHKNETKPIVIVSCEGACLRGEIARKAANQLCHSVIPDRTVRLCLGSALTKQGGQRGLAKNAQRLIVLEGCPVDCGSRLINGLSDDIHPEVIRTDSLADFNKNLFGIDEMSEEEINKQALLVAKKISDILIL